MAKEAPSSSPPLEVFLLPFLAPGHMLPMVDLARLLSIHGCRPTIFTTPVNAASLAPGVDLANRVLDPRRRLGVAVLEFPHAAAGLPEGRENLTFFHSPDVTPEFYLALKLLHAPFEAAVRENRPDCIVADLYYPWANQVAAAAGIPRVLFNGSGCFSLAVSRQLALCRPQDTTSEEFLVPAIPHKISMRRSQLMTFLRPDNTEYSVLSEIVESLKVPFFGSVINSFIDLEKDYVPVESGSSFSWLVGPLSLVNREFQEQTLRGNSSTVDHHSCLRWLDGCQAKSVLYVCFGSLGRFLPSQQLEISLALESCRHPFIWVVKDKPDGDASNGTGSLEWVGEGKGVIIRGWVPQLLILEHEAVGGFMTHCGWNSILESITMGVPMITWPLFAEQSVNEKLVVEVLGIGVSVGVKSCNPRKEERTIVGKERIMEAVEMAMGDEEMRRRTVELAKKAKMAMKEGGSSWEAARRLVQALEEERVKREGNTSLGGEASEPTILL